MTAITNTDQLNTFSIIKTLLRTNSTLNQKFRDGDYYEFLPNTKSIGKGFNGYPFMVINIPLCEDMELYVGDITTEKTFIVSIEMYVEYTARDKVKTYLSQSLSTLRAGNSYFSSNGYALGAVNIIDNPEVYVIEEKQVIRSVISLTLHGEVLVSI